MVTKISASVIGANSITETSVGSNVIVSRHISNTAVVLRHLGTGANASAVQDNVAAAEANIVIVDANVIAITDTTTDLNIGSGKYFFDKSSVSLGIDNIAPIITSVTIGSPANIILNYGETGSTGNITIGPGTAEGFRLNVLGSANVGALTTTSFAPSGVLTLSNITTTTGIATGALLVIGGISTQDNLAVGDDIFMDSDGAIINMGYNDDVSITHVHNKGISINTALGVVGNVVQSASHRAHYGPRALLGYVVVFIILIHVTCS